MASATEAQLSFDVGGPIRRPAGASIQVTGKGDIDTDLHMDDEVVIHIIDARGEVLATFDGTVAGIGFVKHKETDTSPAWVERVHKVKVAPHVEDD